MELDSNAPRVIIVRRNGTNISLLRGGGIDVVGWDPKQRVVVDGGIADLIFW